LLDPPFTHALWLHSWPNLGNAQLQLVLAARQCIDIQTETQRIRKLYKTAIKNANLCRKICNIRTLLKYAKKMWQYATYAVVNHIFA